MKCEALLSILSLLRNTFYELNNTGTQMFDSILYHMAFFLKSHWMR